MNMPEGEQKDNQDNIHPSNNRIKQVQVTGCITIKPPGCACTRKGKVSAPPGIGCVECLWQRMEYLRFTS